MTIKCITFNEDWWPESCAPASLKTVSYSFQQYIIIYREPGRNIFWIPWSRLSPDHQKRSAHCVLQHLKSDSSTSMILEVIVEEVTKHSNLSRFSSDNHERCHFENHFGWTVIFMSQELICLHMWQYDHSIFCFIFSQILIFGSTQCSDRFCSSVTVDLNISKSIHSGLLLQAHYN